MRVLNNKKSITRLIGLLFLSLSFIAVNLSAAEKEAKTDLRVLVDVSGSMKQNDPENLRRTALRLLIGLVPEEARVGIWTFGQYVNMQVKPGFANKAWKKNARVEANNIHSRGLFTNIESTIDKSTWDWRKPDPAWNRHLILLTDGQVDISKDKNKNKVSRGNILKDLLPKLKASGVQIHTVALSKNADHQLLKKISTETSAWYEPVESAERLQKVFLRLFEKSTPTDNVPLDGNRFEVDKSIEDMTVLVFHAEKAKPTRIIRPDNSSFQYGQAPKNVSWHHDKGFDLITIHSPEAGAWSIDAAMDQDNRVQVVTNLKLRIGEIPNNILRNEALRIDAELRENKGLVSNKEILDLVDINVTSKHADVSNSTKMQVAKMPGSYTAEVAGLDKTGAMELVIRATGPTFRRESRHTVRVHENPLQLDISKKENSFFVTITENQGLIQTGTLQLALKFDGDSAAYHVPKTGAHTWQAELSREHAGRKLSVQANANLIGNRVLNTELHGQLPEPEAPFIDPLTIWAEEHEGEIVVQVLETPDVFQVGTLDLKLLLPDLDDLKAESINQMPQVEPNLWRFSIEPAYSEDEVIIQAGAHILTGRIYSEEHKLVLPSIKQPVVEHQEEEKPVEEEHADIVEEHEAPGDEKHERNWVLIVAVIVLINGVIGVGGFFAYRYWHKRDNQVDDELGEDEDAEKEPEVKPEADVPEEEELSFDEDVDIINESSDEEVTSKDDDTPKQDFSDERRSQPSSPAIDLSEGDEVEAENQAPDEEIPTLTDTTDVTSKTEDTAPATEASSDEAVADEWAAALSESGDVPSEEAEAPAAEASSDEAVADEWAAALSEAGAAPDGTVDDTDKPEADKS